MAALFNKNKKGGVKTAAKKEIAAAPAAKTALPHRVVQGLLKQPYLTEKANGLMAKNQYVFLVHGSANKPTIKEEVQRHYNVKVAGVNVIRKGGKAKHIGQIVGRQSEMKKAIVTLAKGQKIEIT